jgi:hypothetical protein
MAATVEGCPTLVVLRDQVVPAPPVGQAARALADGYLRSISASWRGEPGWQAFERALERYWSPELPPVPPTTPDAVSPHGAGGRGIAWYEAGRDILGYVPRVRGGYRVPIETIVPS